MIKNNLVYRYRVNFKEYKENIFNFFCKLYGYDLYMDEEDMNRLVANVINAELRGMEVMDGDDMSWYSPNKEYRFDIYRYDINPNLINSENDPKFNIVIKVYDNTLNIKLTEFSFSEIDAVRILDDIANFSEYCYQTTDSTDIFINPNNTDQVNHMIDIENIYEEEQTTLYGKPITRYNDVLLKILEYNKEQWVPVITMKLTNEELSDFAFVLFFYSLIDLDINDKRIDHIEQYILQKEDYGYGNVDNNQTNILYDSNYINFDKSKINKKPKKMRPLTIEEFNNRE